MTLEEIQDKWPDWGIELDWRNDAFGSEREGRFAVAEGILGGVPVIIELVDGYDCTTNALDALDAALEALTRKDGE